VLVSEAIDQACERPGQISIQAKVGPTKVETMLIGKMFGPEQPRTGLALGCHGDAVLLAAVGIICLVFADRSRKHRAIKIFASKPQPVATSARTRSEFSQSNRSPETENSIRPFSSPKQRPGQPSGLILEVGTLPILSRTLFAAQRMGATRIMCWLTPPPGEECSVRYYLTGRLPKSVEVDRGSAGVSIPNDTAHYQ